MAVLALSAISRFLGLGFLEFLDRNFCVLVHLKLKHLLNLILSLNELLVFLTLGIFDMDTLFALKNIHSLHQILVKFLRTLFAHQLCKTVNPLVGGTHFISQSRPSLEPGSDFFHQFGAGTSLRLGIIRLILKDLLFTVL